MFRKKRETAERIASERFKTLIDASTTVEGRLDISESVRIDGKVIGSINVEPGTKGTVAVADGAVIRGDINAFRVLVAGQVQGNIQAIERVELLSSAQVYGDITYGSLGVAHGAKVAGMLVELAQSNDASTKADALLRTARATGDEVSGA
jgi:cytoskeletal protein CcmA (bactofilin family)